MFISTLALQEDEISDLKTAMKVMTLENAAAHNSIKAWTIELLNESQKFLIENLNESKAQIENFVYNVQGFEDKRGKSLILTNGTLKTNEISAPQPGIRAVDGKPHLVTLQMLDV